MSETAKHVYSDLSRVLPGDMVSCNLLRRLAMATDASFYRLVPEIVVEVQAVLAVTRQHRVAVSRCTPG